MNVLLKEVIFGWKEISIVKILNIFFKISTFSVVRLYHLNEVLKRSLIEFKNVDSLFTVNDILKFSNMFLTI